MATSKEMTAGPALPLIFNFTLPLLFGNLLQQTYSLVDAAIVGKFLGINALASVGASTSVVFLILVKAAYDFALANGMKPKATCSYAVRWLERHPEMNADS